jgi:KDO2-lipid IV(A) lauroyltransferase
MVGVVRGVFALSRALGPERSGAVGAALARRVGPLLRAHRTALANIRAAYPGMPEAEVGPWRGRPGTISAARGPNTRISATCSISIRTAPRPGRTEVDGIEHFLSLRDDGKPGLVFSAHLANWELPAICAARFGLDTTAVFRAPNDPAIARVLHEIRSGTMGNLEAARQGAAFAMQGALEKGGHLGMLIDQHFTRGVIVNFMGRPALVNPVLGKFARRFDCPVHGVRVIRLPGHRFRLQLTPPLDLPRDPDGQVNVQGAMQAMTLVVEGWVREHPEQWLWMHRRWRAPAGARSLPAQNLAQSVAQANVSSQ